MEGLNELVALVLEQLLEGTDPILDVLRCQAENARLVEREITGVGFYCQFEVAPHVPRLAGSSDFTIADVYAECRELRNGVGFVLFVRGGCLDMLEGCTFEEPWPSSVTGVRLSYDREPRVSPAGLARS